MKLEAKEIDIDSPLYVLNLKLKEDLAKFTESYMDTFIKLERLQKERKNAENISKAK